MMKTQPPIPTPRLVLLALASCALLTACLEPEGAAMQQNLDEWVAEQKRLVKPRIATINEPSVFDPQRYEGDANADPFSRVKLTQILSREGQQQERAGMQLLLGERDRRKEELEAHPIDSIIMVGSLAQRGQETALVRVGEMIYQVRVGQYIGQNYGRILAVSENSIQVREIVQDPASGDWQEKMTTINLQEEGK